MPRPTFTDRVSLISLSLVMISTDITAHNYSFCTPNTLSSIGKKRHRLQCGVEGQRGTSKSKVFQPQGASAPDTLTMGVPRPHWGLRLQIPTISSRSAFAMVCPNFQTRRLCRFGWMALHRDSIPARMVTHPCTNRARHRFDSVNALSLCTQRMYYTQMR